MNIVEAADSAGRAFCNMLTRRDQRTMGQYMTPVPVARFMAGRLVAGVRQWHVRVLDPSAGSGVLAAAVIESLLAQPPDEQPNRIELMLFELDARLLRGLRSLCVQMAAECASRSVELTWQVEHGDFLLSSMALSGQAIEGLLTIANPPFLKLNKASDERARRHAYAVYGQPNIYALFMAATARLTAVGGRWCFITPRSWMTGLYFKATRQVVFAHLQVESLHSFDSRTEGFEEDGVLQEVVIAWAAGRSPIESGARVMVSRSRGASDLHDSKVTMLPVEHVLAGDADAMISLPSEGGDRLLPWSTTLESSGLEVRTGPVVAFRATEHVREGAEPDSVPLLWLQHVQQQTVRWPILKKREHIKANACSAWMLVPNMNMVLLRRFSPKEDTRRVTCAAYLGTLPGEVIGLENHLNFVFRPGRGMTADEARGLAAYLASSPVDHYFRAVAGSTQINATELRRLPVPTLDLIERIGRTCREGMSLDEIDRLVETIGPRTAVKSAA